ncbi:FkbM family methyltransferase [Silvimonas amylolytica]|uniref:Methyltransferase FkbM domain-containing protein n=1 Tax=Silvimonas amylolytica TaxID=449663 RepID=A0ABQ2PJ90_9NEIS|nr:FkbM family methyltransferase [Silvimonas amylolytica]GGP25433.1 hypothetical protein GCM10010971_12520 [Silvimonas amylolytica]
MNFVSYAQNLEDVILWRALKQIQNGFYIDVGAAWPVADSVTKAFYDRGWHGINVEPNPQLNQLLVLDRRRDTTLRVAVSDQPGVMAMTFVPDTGLSTLDDNIGQQHQQAGFIARTEEVTVTTLAALWQTHVPAGQEVHFLKVDVEGFETQVLSGNDWVAHRPWVIVVEATLPMSQIESYQGWEPLLLEVGYQLVYVDGLNRYYVAAEHQELAVSFKYPPNVFDRYVMAAQAQAEEQLSSALQRATNAEARVAGAEKRAHEAELDARKARQEAHYWWTVYGGVIHSKSWRLTAPFRVLLREAKVGVRFARAFVKLAPGSLSRRMLGKLLILLGHCPPGLKRPILALIGRFPGVRMKLQALYFSTLHGLDGNKSAVRIGIDDLSPYAQRVYTQITGGVDHKERDVA